MAAKYEPLPVVATFPEQARQAVNAISDEQWLTIRSHVRTISNANIPLFIAFLLPPAAPVLAIYYFYRRVKWEELLREAPLPRIRAAWEAADPEDLKKMKFRTQEARDLGRLFDARNTYKWLIVGCFGILALYAVSICAGFAVGFAR